MRVGILGGGQLGRMLALAAHDLGIPTRCFDQSPDAVAGHVTELHVDSFDRPRELERFLRNVDVVTYEFENVPVGLVEEIAARGVPVRPSPKALAKSQDRWHEKSLFRELMIATPKFALCDSPGSFDVALQDVGSPCVLKTRRFGYDGKGQWMMLDKPRWPDAAAEAAAHTGLIVEQFVPFQREVSVIAVRDLGDEVRVYPVTQNAHAGGILRYSVAPAPELSGSAHKQAEVAVKRLLHATDYVGVLAVEFFEVEGSLVANEMAPRVHNSGHWTMDGSVTSQFENHIRAVCGLPLGDTAMRHPYAAMINLIGVMPDRAALLSACGGRAKLHDYGKQPRPGRKLGHVNVTADSREQLEADIQELQRLIHR